MHLDQSFRVSVEFDVGEDLDEAVFEVGVATYAGDRVVTANSVDRERPPVALEAGRREVSVELDPLLLPGEFAIDVGVHRPDGTTVDYVQGAARLTALNAAEHGEDHYPWNAVRGYVRPAGGVERGPVGRRRPPRGPVRWLRWRPCPLPARPATDARNAAFWDELCGSALARQVGVEDASADSLARFDAAYMASYPYLDSYVPATPRPAPSCSRSGSATARSARC